MLPAQVRMEQLDSQTITLRRAAHEIGVSVDHLSSTHRSW
jgi:hypothetical protein